MKKCLTFLENKKREGIKCANEEHASVFLNARSQNAWQNAKCARSTFMKELVPVLAAVAIEGIKSIQTIGVEWKRDKPTRIKY